MSLLKDKIELEVELAEFKAKQSLEQFPKVLRFIFIATLLCIIPGYFLAKHFSYTHWRSFYSQYIITAKPSFTDPKTPSISNVFLTTSGSGNFSAAMEITNNNLDLALSKFSYEFVFFGENNEQIYKEPGTTFLLPNEKKYLVVPKFSSTEPIKSAGFNFTSDLHWQKRSNVTKISIQTTAPLGYNQFTPPAFVVDGNYFNNSPYQLGQVRLTFLIFDKSGSIVGISRRDDFKVTPFERRAYKQIWPNIYGDPSYEVKVFAETNVLDPNNLTLPDVPTDSSADLSRPSGENN